MYCTVLYLGGCDLLGVGGATYLPTEWWMVVVGIRIGIGIWGFGDWGLEVDRSACISNGFWRGDRVITSVLFQVLFCFGLEVFIDD